MVINSRKEDNFIVGISRDYELIQYSRPDLVITTHRINSDIKLPTIYLNDFSGAENRIVYDTELMAAIDGGNPEFSASAMDLIYKRARGRNVLIVPYYNAWTTQLRRNGYFIAGSSDMMVREYSRKVIAFTVGNQLGIKVANGRILSNYEKMSQYAKTRLLQNPLFIATDGDPFFPINRKISSFSQVDLLPKDCGYLVTDWIKPLASINTQAIINNTSIYYLGTTDQIIENDTKYSGNLWPSSISDEQKQLAKKQTLEIAKFMQSRGYRGFIGLDWVLSDNGELFFIEINPRKNRSSGVMCAFLDVHRHEDSPSAIDFELNSRVFSPTASYTYSLPMNIHWGMKVFKGGGQIEVIKNIGPKFSEKDMFDKDNLGKYSILDMPTAGSQLSYYPDLARIVATGESREKVLKLIEEAETQIRSAIK